MKIPYFKNVVISLGLLSAQSLFAQYNKNQEQITPVLQTVHEYSNIIGYAENSNFIPIAQTNFHVDLTPEMQMNPAVEEGAEVLEATLGLEAFRQAVETHPKAERLVIHREGGEASIRPQGSSQDVIGTHQGENKAIIDQLRVLLPELSTDPLLNYQISSNNSGVRIGVDTLSSTRLQAILNRLDTIRSTAHSSISTSQSHDNESNVFSTSQQKIDSIDQALAKRTQEAINKMISDSSAQLQNYYQDADQAWEKYNNQWTEYNQFQPLFQEKRKQLVQAQKKLDEATKATTDEELQKTRLGKIYRYLTPVGTVVSNVPVPGVQVAGMGISGAAGLAGVVNIVWAHANKALTESEHKKVQKEHNNAQMKEIELHKQLVSLESRATEMETSAFKQVEEAARILAKQLRPEVNWKESHHQAWGAFVGPMLLGKDRSDLVNLVRDCPDWVEEVTKKSWQQKIEAGKERYITLHKQANLPSLKSDYKKALQQHQHAETKETTQQISLEEIQKTIKNLKEDIEIRTDELEKLENKDSVKFEQKKKEFINKFKELEQKQQKNEELQKKWEEAVQQENKQREQLQGVSKIYQTAKESAARTLARIKKAHQVDQELWKEVWLCNYKDWSLPEPIFSKTVSSQLSENTQGEKCDPPLQRLEELEAKGRDLQMRISSLNATVTAKSSTLPTTGVISLSRPAPLSKQTSFIYSAPSSLDQVRAWVEEKLEYPSAQDQERWEVLEKLDQLQKEVRIKSKELQNNFYAKGNVQSNEIDDDNEAKTVISTATEQTISTQTSSAPSTFSRLSSVLSFSGRTQVNNTNTKKPVLPLSTISETSEESQEIGKTQDFQNPLKQLEQLLNQIDELNSKYLKLIDDAEKERCSDSELGQEGAISFNKEEERDYAWEKADTQCVAVLQKRREREELQKIALEQKKSWQLNTKRWELRVQADETYEKYEQAQQDAVKCAEEAGKIRGKTKGQQEKDNKKWKEASEEAEKLREIYLAAEEKWEKKAQEYSDEYLGQRDTQEQANERLKERDRAVNKRWEKLLKSYQNPESEESVVEQDIIAYRIMDLEKNLNQAFRGSIKNTNDRGAALIHYRDQALRYALIDACDYPEELKEAWEKMSVSTERIDKDQQKINKEAAEVFLKEVKRFEKIEKIWKGVLKEKQDQAKQKQDEAVQEYYRGNYFDWNNLSEEERERYNSEVEKANEEYEQKITEAKELNNKKIEIETNIKQIEEKEKKSWNLLGTHKQKRQEKLKYYRQQLEVLKHLIQKTPEQLKEQKAFLNIGKRARPKEKAYEALLQSQRIKEKKEAKEGDENSCWNKAATCYLQANTRWEKAAYDKGDNTISEEKHKKNEKIALSYEKAAESYEKAVPENDALNGKKNLIQLYGEAAKLYEQLAKQLEKEEVKTDTFEIEETLYQLEKKIELYLTSFGVQIEELQENIPLLQNRLEEMGKKVISLRSPNKEILGVKQEAVIADLRELIGTCQKALEDLLQEVPESGARAAKAIASIQTQQIKAQQVQITIEQTGQLEVEILSLEIKQKMLQAHVEGENFVDKGQKKLLKQCDPLLFEARTVQNDLIRQSEGGSDLLAYFQSCMDKLQQFKEQDQYLQQITPQLQSLEHDKAILEKRYTTLENDIKVSKNQGEIFIAQGQEKLLENAKKLISKINITSRDLLAKAEKAFEQKENLLHLIDQFHKEEEELYFKIASLRELDKHKNHFQNLKKVLSKKIAASKNQGEIFFKEAQQQLLNEINQRFPEIEKTTTQIIKGDNNSSEETNILLLQLEQLEQRYQVLKNNASILLSLGEKKNFLQDRLKNLTEESKVPLNEWKTYLNNRWRSYLNESQEYIVSDMTQLLLQIDPIAKQLIAGQSKDLEAAQSLLTQLEQFIQRDQLFQQNSPYLGKLDEIKNLFQNYVEIINRELDPARDRQELLVLQRKQLEEFSQMLAKIDHTAKQLLPSSLIITTKEQLNILFNEIDLLKQKYQYNIQVKNFLQKENYLKYRAKVLESEMTVSIGQGETVLSQRQQTLLVEINNALQQSALMVDKILSKDNIENNLTMPLFYLDQLLDKDKKLQKEFLYLKRQDV